MYIYIYIHIHVFKNPAMHLLFSHQKCLFLIRNQKIYTIEAFLEACWSYNNGDAISLKIWNRESLNIPTGIWDLDPAI